MNDTTKNTDLLTIWARVKTNPPEPIQPPKPIARVRGNISAQDWRTLHIRACGKGLEIDYLDHPKPGDERLPVVSV